MNVLLTNPNYKHTWALAVHFHKKGHKVYCISKKKFSLLSASRFVQKVIFIEDLTEDSCYSIFNKYSIDIVVPVGFAETLIFSKFINNSKFRDMITVTNYENILFASSKKKYQNTYKTLGFQYQKLTISVAINLTKTKHILIKSFLLSPLKKV